MLGTMSQPAGRSEQPWKCPLVISMSQVFGGGESVMSHVSRCAVYSTVIAAFLIFSSIQCLIQASESIDEKRGGGRHFQLESGLSEKRGARGFLVPDSQKKRGGGRLFQGFEEKRGGGRNFGFINSQSKRGGGHVFSLADKAEHKRGGGRTFGFVDSHEKRDGVHAFGYSESQEKRGGARMFGFAEQEDKRGGGRGFSSIRDVSELGEQKRAETIPVQPFKRGGGHLFASPDSSGYYVPHAGYSGFTFDKRSAVAFEQPFYGEGLRENNGIRSFDEDGL